MLADLDDFGDVAKTTLSLRTVSEEAAADLRRLARDLRPRILDDLGLLPAVEWRAELEVSIDPTTAGLRVSIQDNGIGFEVIPETGAFDQLDRYVILGKQERARLNGGDLQLGSNLGIGTTVTRGLAWASQAKAGY